LRHEQISAIVSVMALMFNGKPLKLRRIFYVFTGT
jgi:hypothetical protein